jgi:hypothetical protein
MLRTASSLPLAGLLTLGSDPARFPAEPPACYRASWQLSEPDFHRQATTSLRTARSTVALSHGGTPPVLLSARKGTVQRTVFLARHAGLRSGGMGTVSDDIGCCECTQERQE